MNAEGPSLKRRCSTVASEWKCREKPSIAKGESGSSSICNDEMGLDLKPSSAPQYYTVLHKQSYLTAGD